MFTLIGLVFDLLIGAAAGYIAARIMGLDSSNIVQNCCLGLAGGIVFGFLAGLFGIASTNLIGHLIFAVAGACLVVYGYRRFIR